MSTTFDQLTIAEFTISIQPEELSFEQALQLFERLYMASRNLAPRTRVEYRTDLRQLCYFLSRHRVAKPLEVSLRHLQAFLAHLDGRNHAAATRRRKTSSIKSFFGFLYTVGLVPEDPALQLTPPERGEKELRFLTKQEYQSLQTACADHPRDAAVIELLLQTGIRLSEAARLTLGDVHLPERISREAAGTGTLFIRGKGSKQRILPLNYKTCRALSRWLRVRPRVAAPALFVTKFQKAMGPRAIQRVVKKYLKEANIQGASVETLRHTFAVQHLMNGSKTRTVQEILGHADERTTSKYRRLAGRALMQELQEHAL